MIWERSAGGQSAQSIANLPAHHFQRLARIALGQRFPHANNRFQTARNGRASFLFHGLVGFAEELTALGMADDGVGAAGIQKHPDRNFAGECALIVPINILSGDRDARTLRFIHGRWPTP